MMEASFNAMNDGVAITDLDDRLIYANPSYLRIRHIDSINNDGQLLKHLLHPNNQFSQCGSCRARAEGRSAVLIEKSDEPNGRHLEVRVNPILDQENCRTGSVEVVRDITEERTAAEQSMRSDKLRALGQIAWGIAHNFNNSLTAILGYTQLVQGKIQDPALLRNLQTVEQAALDAAKMVQRIQNFARQSHDAVFGPADLNQMIRDALDLTRSKWRDDAHAAGISYDVRFDPSVEAATLCDQSAMREVFVNIIINAIEAMPTGGRLLITNAIEDEHLLITFSDTGTGMSGETRQRLFEPFYTTKGAKVQGMGLSASYGIIERHGGTITVNTESGKGTSFTIRLKCAPKTEASSQVLAGKIVVPPASVLIVDDEAPIRALLSDILRARGHAVTTAEDGLDGLRNVQKSKFDMVITDLSMPGADGWTVALEAKRRCAGTIIVILTGYGQSAERAVPGGDHSGVDAILSKPFKIAEIDQTLSHLLAVRK